MNESWKAFFLPQLLKKEPTKTKMRKKLLQGEFLGREVEQENSNTDEKNNKQPKVMLFLFIIPILLLILLTGIVLIGLHFIEQDGSSNTSQVARLAALIVIISVILLSIGAWKIWFSIRYIQIPTWRWIASGFKGGGKLPGFPWATRSAMAKARIERNKKQRALMWLGHICCVAGVILSINYVVSGWIFTIKGERHFGGFRFVLFCAGVFIFFLGMCIMKYSMPKETQKHTASTK